MFWRFSCSELAGVRNQIHRICTPLTCRLPDSAPSPPILHQPPATTPQVQAQQLEPGASVSAHRDALPFGGDRISTVVLQGSGVVRVGHQSFEARRGAEVRVHTVWEERKGR